jgi:phosphohistidine phosphatase
MPMKSREENETTPARSYTLYLVRHAIAAPRGKEWPDDAKRPLTQKGISRMRKAVDGLRALGVKIDLVLTSPLVRARQTAEILVHGLKPAPALTVIEPLAPGVTPPHLAHALEHFRKTRSIALVGHEPGLGEFAAWLTGARTPFAFKKGSVCRIDVSALPPAPNGQLVWMATPRMLRDLE